MKPLFWLVMGVLVVTAFVGRGAGFAAETLKGEVVKIDGDMVQVKDDTGVVRTIHNDSMGTMRTGEVKVGAMIEADVTSTGHANAIMVKMKKMKKEMKEEKKEMKKKMKKEMKEEMKK